MITPWIGPDYGRAANRFGGVRLLVLGESSHSQDHAVGSTPAGLLRELVARFIQEAPDWDFFKKITTLLSGATAWSAVRESDRRAVWNAIAFMNVVDGVAAGYSRERPSREAFIAGAESLGERVALIEPRPEAVLVVGRDASGWVARGQGVTQAWGQKAYAIDGIPATYVNHTSGGLSCEEGREALSGLLAEARGTAPAAD